MNVKEIMSDSVMELLDEKGNLPAHSSLGGYPLFYVCVHEDLRYEVLCADCANNEERRQEMLDYNESIEKVDVNWEDRELYCDCCEDHIKSAYGEDETE